MPWAAQIANALTRAHSLSPTAASDLPPPGSANNSMDWLKYITTQQDKWRIVVSRCSFCESVVDRQSSNERVSPQICCLNHVCSMCSAGSPTAKALGQHARKAHAAKSVIQTFVAESSVCQCCSTDFVQRLRLVAHLSDTRQGRVKCRNFYIANVPPLPTDVTGELHKKDLVLQRAARREGHTHAIASIGAKTGQGKRVGFVHR